MKALALAAAILGVAVSAVSAQQDAAIPDLKGTWTGKGKAVVLGTNAYHPGPKGKAATPRVRERPTSSRAKTAASPGAAH